MIQPVILPDEEFSELPKLSEKRPPEVRVDNLERKAQQEEKKDEKLEDATYEEPESDNIFGGSSSENSPALPQPSRA